MILLCVYDLYHLYPQIISNHRLTWVFFHDHHFFSLMTFFQFCIHALSPQKKRKNQASWSRSAKACDKVVTSWRGAQEGPKPPRLTISWMARCLEKIPNIFLKMVGERWLGNHDRKQTNHPKKIHTSWSEWKHGLKPTATYHLNPIHKKQKRATFHSSAVVFVGCHQNSFRAKKNCPMVCWTKLKPLA